MVFGDPEFPLFAEMKATSRVFAGIVLPNTPVPLTCGLVMMVFSDVPLVRTTTPTAGAASSGPVEATNAMVLPGFTLDPAARLWLMTLPAATVALSAVVTVPTASPAALINVVAAACEIDGVTTFGTTVPLERTNARPLPITTPRVRKPGSWLMTVPIAAVVLGADVTAPTIRPAAMICGV